MRPATTRLRYISAKKPGDLEKFLGRLGFRVQIYSVQWDGKRWVLWCVPPDDISKDFKSIDL